MVTLNTVYKKTVLVPQWKTFLRKINNFVHVLSFAFAFFWCCIHFEIFLWGPVKHGQPSEKRLNWSIGEICYACMFLVRKSRVDFKWKKISVLLLFSLIIFDYFKTKIKSTKIKVFKIGFDFQYIWNSKILGCRDPRYKHEYLDSR